MGKTHRASRPSEKKPEVTSRDPHDQGYFILDFTGCRRILLDITHEEAADEA